MLNTTGSSGHSREEGKPKPPPLLPRDRLVRTKSVQIYDNVGTTTKTQSPWDGFASVLLGRQAPSHLSELLPDHLKGFYLYIFTFHTCASSSPSKEFSEHINMLKSDGLYLTKENTNLSLLACVKNNCTEANSLQQPQRVPPLSWN